MCNGLAQELSVLARMVVESIKIFCLPGDDDGMVAILHFKALCRIAALLMYHGGK